MSKAARQWLSRQHVAGASQNLVLRVLADAADKDGCVKLSQKIIADRAGLGERTARRALDAIEASGILRREHRSAGGRKGRITDLIFLNLDGEPWVQPAKMAANNVGATGKSGRLQSWVQPAKMAVAPTNDPEPEKPNKNNASRARGCSIYTSPDELSARTSGRVWFEKSRGTWRARVRHDGIELDLGRFDTEPDAARALEGALSDIEHATSTKAGTPREPRPSRTDLDVATISDALPDHWSVRWRERYRLLAGERRKTSAGEEYLILEHDLKERWIRVRMVRTGETFIAEAPPGDDLVRLNGKRRRVAAPSMQPDASMTGEKT